MHDLEKSDSGIVAEKPTNKAGQPAAEPAEPRPETEGNANQQSTLRTQGRALVTQALGRVRQAARQRKKEKFTALLHHISVDTLRVAYYALKRKAAPGVDGVTWADYEAELESRLADLHERVHRGAYRPQPSRRTYIPKADGKQRPLAIAALEDKIVQGATVIVLNAIYEEEFLGFSYGFRPGRGPHDALDALWMGITSRKVNWIVDADIQNCFGSVSQEWLVRFLEHRIVNRRAKGTPHRHAKRTPVTGGAGRPRSPWRGPARVAQCLTSDGAARVGRCCGPPGASRGLGLHCCFNRARSRAAARSRRPRRDRDR
jgi:RNA-directed DNA polymerase